MHKPLILLSILLFTSCKTVDLRTNELKKNPTIQKEQQGRALLQEMYEAHGGDHWKQINTYTVSINDRFFGLSRLGSPFGKEFDVTLDMTPLRFTSRASFEKGKRVSGQTWGIHNGKTYKVENGQASLKPNKKMAFWLPAIQYFIELPAQIQNATAVSYLGERSEDDSTYDLVIASWNTIAPQKDTDQFVLWIDQQTHRVYKVAFTVRDLGKNIHNEIYYSDYRELDGGIILPFRMPVVKASSGKRIHEIQIKSYELNKVDVSELEVY